MTLHSNTPGDNWQKSSLNVALDYLSANPDRYLFPIREGQKSPPLIEDNLNKASADPVQIKRWHMRWPGCNWGLALKKSGLIVIDVDTKPGKNGAETLANLDLLYGIEPTETVRTPSGGKHLYYRGRHVFALGKNGFGLDIDSPSYTLIPGCSVNGDEYVDEGGNTAKAPDWFYQVLKNRPASTGDTTRPVIDYDKPENIAWARIFLEKDAPPAIEGKLGDATTLKVALELRDHGISPETSVELMEEFYNRRCEPPWEPDELERKVRNAYQYGHINAPGSQTAEADFAHDDTVFEETDEERALRKQREQKERQHAEKDSGLPKGVTDEDFYAYQPEGKYIFLLTGALWPKESVNAAIRGASKRLNKNRAVQCMTWAPGEPTIIEGKLVNGEDVVSRPGMRTFNRYRAPRPIAATADARQAQPWRDHLHFIYADDADHIEKWFAHRVQRPGEKINHVLVLGGPVRIGKDSLMQPLLRGVGDANFREITASQAMEPRFNGFLEAVVIRISEARDFGDRDRYKFYERWKPWLTSPPNVMQVEDKYVKAHSVINCFGAIITSNHKHGGLYLPPDDARHYVAWSEQTREAIDARDPEYFPKLWRWYEEGGVDHVVAYLKQLDLSGFAAKAPPRRTPAWQAMVQAHESPVDGELKDVIQSMAPLGLLGDDPLAPVEAFTIAQVIERAKDNNYWEVAASLQKPPNHLIPKRLDDCGYEAAVRPGGDNRWKVGGRKAVIYALKSLTAAEKQKAAAMVVDRARPRR